MLPDRQPLPEELAALYELSCCRCRLLGTVLAQARVAQALQVTGWKCHDYEFVIWRYDVLGETYDNPPYLLFWYPDEAVARDWIQRLAVMSPDVWDGALRNRSDARRIEEQRCAKDIPFFLRDELIGPLSSVA